MSNHRHVFREFRFLALAAIAVAGAPGVTRAQDSFDGLRTGWPTRTVQIVVPFTPGTGADILSRAARDPGSPSAGKWLSSPTTGRARRANIGTEVVSKAPPDGHTVLFTATSFGMTPALYRKLPFDPVTSFRPVAMHRHGRSRASVVHPQLPVKSAREFIQLAKRRPGELLYSSPGNGGPQHLTMELLKLETGINIVHVPYKGLAGAITDVMAGHVQAMVSALQTAAPYVRSGTAAHARGDERRSARRRSPDVPTMKELGCRRISRSIRGMACSHRPGRPRSRSPGSMPISMRCFSNPRSASCLRSRA